MGLHWHDFVPKCLYDFELRSACKGEKFTYRGYRCKAKVVDIYDGDTLTLVFRHRGHLEQHSCRMVGYDSPEMKPPKSDPNREREIAAAKRARAALQGMVSDGLVRVECGDFDKYGRILVTLYVRDPQAGGCPGFGICGRPAEIEVNRWMVEEGHGIPYDGGTKRKIIY